MLANETLPRDLRSAFAWKFEHPEGRFKTVMRGNPLIDSQRNVLILTENGLFKLDPQGTIIWVYFPPTLSLMNIVPCIMDDVVYGMAMDATVYALDLWTGKELWRRRHALNAGPDTAYVDAHDGILLAGVDMSLPYGGGNLRVLGMNTSDGDLLWEFRIDLPSWNFNPLFPGDGSFIFMDVSGGVHSVEHRSGKPRWYAPVPPHWAHSFTDGGVMLDPLGKVAFACSNNGHDKNGIMRAYRIEDGKRLWEKPLPTGCSSWPVIARTGDWGVLPAGHFVDTPLCMHLPNWLPINVKAFIHRLDMFLGDRMRLLAPLTDKKVRDVHTEIMAFNTTTGVTLWSYRTPDWLRLAARGDDEGLIPRTSSGRNPICLPTSWGTPTLSGDDTVYVGHVSGILYAVKDHNGDGRIDPDTEVSTFDMQAAPLPNNPAWAPGMMAVASCDTLFVFKS